MQQAIFMEASWDECETFEADAQSSKEHGSGLGKFRWVVERTHAWLHNFRRLRIRFERRADIHEAFLKLGCSLVCWKIFRRTEQPF